MSAQFAEVVSLLQITGWDKDLFQLFDFTMRWRFVSDICHEKRISFEIFDFTVGRGFFQIFAMRRGFISDIWLHQEENVCFIYLPRQEDLFQIFDFTVRRGFVSYICHKKRICSQIFQGRTGSKYFRRGYVSNHNEEEDLFQIFQERTCWRTWCCGRQPPTVVSPTAYSAYTHFGSGAPPMPPVLPVSTQASPIPPHPTPSPPDPHSCQLLTAQGPLHHQFKKKKTFSQ